MDKDQLAPILERGGVKPVDRRRIGQNEIFIADGFVPPPHYHLARFGVKPDEFPQGCYMTVWWVDHKKGRGGAAFFDPDHDPLMMQSYKRQARINSMIRAAANDIRRSNANS